MFIRYNFRPEVDSNVLAGLAVDGGGMDVPVKFDDSRSNGSQDIRGADCLLNERMKITKACHIRQKRLKAYRTKAYRLMIITFV